MTKRRAALVLLVPAALLAILSTRDWVTSPRYGAGGPLGSPGTELAPGILALALVSLAAGVAVLATGRRLRLVSATVLTLAALSATVLTLVVVADPGGAALRTFSSVPTATFTDATGRTGTGTGTVGVAAHLTVWIWLALVVAVVLTLAGLVTIPAARGWDGLSSRFERPSGEVSPEVADQVARHSAWEDLSQGVDPTVDDRP